MPAILEETCITRAIRNKSKTRKLRRLATAELTRISKGSIFLVVLVVKRLQFQDACIWTL